MTRSRPLTLLFFEDEKSISFQPLTLTRPMDDLRVGILTIREKWERALTPSAVSRVVRSELSALFPVGPSPVTNPPGSAPKNTDEQPWPVSPGHNCLIINSRLLPGNTILSAIASLSPGEAIKTEEEFLAGLLNSDAAAELPVNPADFNMQLADRFSNVNSISNEGVFLADTLPDLLTLNGAEISRDIELLNPGHRGSRISLSPHALLYFENSIFIGDDVKIEPGVTLIAEDGPIFIGNGATLMAGSVVRGPAAVCSGSTLKMGAKIYGETTIGPVCKVGGEVQNVIFHSYSNKGHDGYAGNSIFGQWCNLGADTNTSNLKNNYSPVIITDWASGKDWNTRELFFGTVMGDHSKTGINTMLNTGTMIGVSCNIFGGGFPPRHIPSFSWVNSTKVDKYHFDKAAETMQRVMTRRNMDATDPYISMMKTIAGS